MAQSAVAQKRRSPASQAAPGCPFCQGQLGPRVTAQHGTACALLDGFPVTPMHHLVVPARHTATFFDMTQEEQADALALLELLKTRIQEADGSVTGFNIGMNCGDSAGQTVPHAHIHLIPRRPGDMQDPRGGVRGVIPARQRY